MTAVDWFPASPRFQLSYHILSHAFKERIRLRAMIDEPDPTIDSITSVWAGAKLLLNARSSTCLEFVSPATPICAES